MFLFTEDVVGKEKEGGAQQHQAAAEVKRSV